MLWPTRFFHPLFLALCRLRMRSSKMFGTHDRRAHSCSMLAVSADVMLVPGSPAQSSSWSLAGGGALECC